MLEFKLKQKILQCDDFMLPFINNILVKTGYLTLIDISFIVLEA